MAHFAELDENSHVVRVLVIANPDTADADGVEDEAIGSAYLTALLPDSGTWVQTSYNNTIRREFANAGMAYDPTLEVFYGLNPPHDCSSYIFDDVTKTWEPPTPRPGEAWWWDDDAVQWVKGPWGMSETPPWVGSAWDDDTGWDDGNPDWSSYPGTVTEDGDPREAPFYLWNGDTTSWVEVP